MKIVGFSQLRNEHSKGNLINWLKCMDMCDFIYIYDQNSDDGSKEIYYKNPKCVVVESPTNNFANENLCKAVLLNKLLNEHPDAGWIFWMDGDYLLDGRYLENNFEKFFNMCENGLKNNIDGISFGHYNLWRSDLHYRIDSDYHNSFAPGRISLWRNNGQLIMHTIAGLHKNPIPSGINSVQRVDCNLIHRGFATDDQIILKYEVYKSFGQTGLDLERILDESLLKVEVLDKKLLPSWFVVSDELDPNKKKKIKEKYFERMNKNA
jgi:hypothetical protein